MAKLASKFVVSVSLHKSRVNLPVTMHPHQHLEIVKIFCPSFVALIFVPLITNTIDHSLMFLLVILVSSVKCLFLSLNACFYIEFFSLYWMCKDSKFLSVTWITNKLSLSVVWPDFIYRVPCLTEDFNIFILSFMVVPFCVFIFIYLFFLFASLKKCLFIFWATLQGMWDLNSPTRDWTHALCIGSLEF